MSRCVYSRSEKTSRSLTGQMESTSPLKAVVSLKEGTAVSDVKHLKPKEHKESRQHDTTKTSQ